MRLDDFLDFLEHRIKSRVPPESLEDAILCAIQDTRDKAELDQEEDDAIWHSVQSADMGQG